MRFQKTDIEKRVRIRLDKTIKSQSQNVNGIMLFGKENDYPQLIERIVNNSITAKSVKNIYSKFLCGQGFEQPEINKVIIGKDNKGKNITLKKLLSLVCDSLALNNGAYIHVNYNMDFKAVNSKLVSFKYCRFSKIDDNGYTSKIGVYENWDKDQDYWKDRKYNKNDIRFYNIFSSEKEVFLSHLKELNGNIKKYKGQINYLFLDDQYLYPLSPFDEVYLDCDTEYQVAIFKNNTTRNGMTKKTILRMQEPVNETDEDELKVTIKNWQGADGDNVLVLYDEIDQETGQIKNTGAFAADVLESAIDDKLFDGWQTELTNNIRKAVKALPAILIDYDESKLGTTSGEAIIQAVNFYNAMTEDDRSQISNFFQEIFSKFDNNTLSNNTNWNIKPLDLYGKFTTNIQPAATN